MHAAGADAYLELLKKTLIRLPLGDDDLALRHTIDGIDGDLLHEIDRWIDACRTGASGERPPDIDVRTAGVDWPATGESMIGLFRLNQLHTSLADIIRRGVPGDVAEAGVWRGGATIFMRALLRVFAEERRIVWVADSFSGLPPPDPAHYPADAGDEHWRSPELSVSLEEVQANFARYGVLDSRVRFLAGWFRDTLPRAPIERLALLRIDGDMYESTIVALRALYSTVAQGGCVVVDDYALPACRRAVDDFRTEQHIGEPLVPIDWTGVMWQVR